MERHNGLEPDPEGAFVYHDDAQATIAALQTRVKELEQIAISHDQSMRYITGQAKRTHEKLTTVQATLTQRTAERDTARRRVDELEAREVDVVLLREDLERRTAELEAAKRDLGRAYESEKSMDRIMRIEEASSRVMIDRLRAELERVRGERDNLQLQVHVYQNGDAKNNALAQDIERWRVEYVTQHRQGGDYSHHSAFDEYGEHR